MTAQAWAGLLPAAMVGTDRHAGALPSCPEPIAAFAQDVARAGDGPADALLRVAAVVAACSLAGARGPLRSEPLPPPAPEDGLPAVAPGPLLEAVRWALHDGSSRLQQAVCTALAAAGLRLPPLLLPQALELGRRSLPLRAVLRPVLGERGRWLATQRDDWAYAASGSVGASTDVSQWNEGTLEQRRAYLVQERAIDPAAARARLQDALPALPARERAELVAALAVGLHDEDEALLDALRADRSREVRQAALALLLRLPQAAHPRRAAARMAALMSAASGLPGARWQIDAPEAAADDWKADQIDAVRPQHESLGTRGWWLYQLVRQVPLRWWSEHTAQSPAELLAWAAGTDWANALLQGWRDVLFAAPDEAWCDALLDAWPRALRVQPHEVLALLSPARRERHLRQRLRDPKEPLHMTLAQVLSACPAGESLSREISLQISERVRERSAQLNDASALRGLLAELACVLHPDALDAYAAMPRPEVTTPSCAEALQTTAQVVAVRRALLTLPARTP